MQHSCPPEVRSRSPEVTCRHEPFDKLRIYDTSTAISADRNVRSPLPYHVAQGLISLYPFLFQIRAPLSRISR